MTQTAVLKDYKAHLLTELSFFKEIEQAEQTLEAKRAELLERLAGVATATATKATTPVTTAAAVAPTKTKRVYVSSLTQEQIKAIVGLKSGTPSLTIVDIAAQTQLPVSGVRTVLKRHGFWTGRGVFDDSQRLEIFDDRHVRGMTTAQIVAKWNDFYVLNTKAHRPLVESDIEITLFRLEQKMKQKTKQTATA